MLTPEERALRARLAAHEQHAKHDARQTTANGRQAFQASFEEQVDPEGILEPEERQRRAAQARKAHYTRMAFESAKVRRANKQAKQNISEEPPIAAAHMEVA